MEQFPVLPSTGTPVGTAVHGTESAGAAERLAAIGRLIHEMAPHAREQVAAAVRAGRAASPELCQFLATCGRVTGLGEALALLRREAAQ